MRVMRMPLAAPRTSNLVAIKLITPEDRMEVREACEVAQCCLVVARCVTCAANGKFSDRLMPSLSKTAGYLNALCQEALALRHCPVLFACFEPLPSPRTDWCLIYLRRLPSHNEFQMLAGPSTLFVACFFLFAVAVAGDG